MRALILNEPRDLVLGEIDDPGLPGAGEVRVRVGAVGICGSDIHYFEHGRIGDFVVEAPMVLGHEAAGTVESVGPGVDDLSPGDRVAMEPGVPCGQCKVCRAGRYNLCRDVRFWATPPVDGALAEYVVHPASYACRLPESLTLEEGALIEPLAVAVHACIRGRAGPGDSVAIVGAGTIGSVSILVARAFGAHTVIVSDLVPERLARAESLGATAVVDARTASLADEAMRITGGTGVDFGIECAGSPDGLQTLIRAAAPAGRIVLIGMGAQPVEVDTVAAMVNELDILTVFRYANAYPTAIDLVASGRIDVKPLVTDRFPFERAVDAFEYARSPRPETCKIIIDL